MPMSPKTLLLGLEAGRVGVWSWDVETGRVEWSQNLERIHGLAPGHFDGSFSVFENDIHPDDREHVMATVQTTLANGGAYRVEYRLPPTDDGESRWLEARGEAVMCEGAVTRMTGVCQDISDRKRSEIEVERRSRQHEVIAQLGELALREQPLQTLFDTAVREVARVLEVDFCKLLEVLPGGEKMRLRAGVGWQPGLVGQALVDAELGSQAGYTLMVDHATVVDDLATETRFTGATLLQQHGAVSGLSVVIAGEAGEAFGALGAHSKHPRRFASTDVNFLQSAANILATAIQRQNAAERQTLLVRELGHRVGNILALVLSLFSNTARTAASTAELAEKFETRLLSLSKVHGLISKGGWSATGLTTVVRSILEPYLDRVELTGRDVKLSADAAFHLSLALHELATNAAKYGALSAPGGTLAVRWGGEPREAGEVVVLEWEERGGPIVRHPERRGFGSKLVDALVRRQIRGEIAVDFAETGLKVQLTLPLADDGEQAYVKIA